MVLETIWFRAACLGFFPPFPHYFIFFLPLWGFLLFQRNFGYFWRKMPFGGILGPLEAFQVVLWPFGGILGLLEAFQWDFQGNMVGKQTNEPCSEIDKVVNHFWVLTMTTMPIHTAMNATNNNAKVSWINVYKQKSCGSNLNTNSLTSF